MAITETTTLVIIVLCVAVSVIITTLRYLVRACSQSASKWTIDDTSILVSVILHISLAADGILLLRLRMSKSSIEYAQKLFMAGGVLYIASLWSIKLSIILFYMRLTRSLRGPFIATIVTTCFIIATLIVSLTLEIYLCIPGTQRAITSCVASKKSYSFWILVAFNLCTDIMLFVIPFPVLSLISQRRVRFTTYGVFGLGGFLMILSIIRAIVIATSGEKGVILVLSNIEIATGIFISATPFLSKHFTQKYLTRPSSDTFNEEDIRFADQAHAKKLMTQNTISSSATDTPVLVI